MAEMTKQERVQALVDQGMDHADAVDWVYGDVVALDEHGRRMARHSPDIFSDAPAPEPAPAPPGVTYDPDD